MLVVTIFSTVSCDMLNTKDLGPTSAEIIDGLKTALTIGTDSSSSKLSAVDGYFRDQTVKILLPPQAQAILTYKDNSIFQNLGLTSQINTQIDNVILSINRSAEKAAKSAAPIFVNAITNLTINDGLSILNGVVPTTTKSGTTAFDSLAATHYLSNQTYISLSNTFKPPIDSALNNDLGLGFSANQAWTTLTNLYNQGVQANNAAYLLGISTVHLDSITVDLGTYCTNKALDGLFLKVGNEERKIRANPYNYASDIIKKVFGSVAK